MYTNVSAGTGEYIMSDSRTFAASAEFEGGLKLRPREIISAQISYSLPDDDITPGQVITAQASITAAADIGDIEGAAFMLYLMPLIDSSSGGTTYDRLSDYTYSQLSEYTYGELSNLPGEPVPMGRFKVTSVRLTGNKAVIEAHDAFYNCDEKYVSTLSLPTTSQLVQQEICNRLGIKGVGTSFSISLPSLPDDCTCREMLGLIAQLDGGKCVMLDRNGYLVHRGMAAAGYNVSRSRSAEPEAEKKPITVTGLHCDKSESIYYQSGSTTRMITFSNPYMMQSIFNRIADVYVGLSYTPLSAKYILGDPRLEVLDIVTVEGSGEDTRYDVPLTDLTYSFDGGLSCEINATGKTDAQTKNSDGPMTRAVKSLIEYAKNATEETLREAFRDAIDYITGANGGYHIQIFNNSGQPIHDYWADNLDIDRAQNIIMINQNGILGTNSGLNGVWKTAITNDGRINASQILTGTLSAIVIQSVGYSAGVRGSRLDLSSGVFDFGGGALGWDGIQLNIGDKLTYKASTGKLDIEGKVTVSDSDSKAILDDAKLKLYRDDDYIGFIGTQKDNNGKRGIVFDLNYNSGDYLAWSAQETAGGNYVQKLRWDRENGFRFSDTVYFVGSDLTVGNGNEADVYRGINMNGYDIENVDLDGDLMIKSGNDVDVYRHINMHNYDIKNVDIVISSDRRLKDNIKDSDVNATKVIRAIRPREFDWKADGRHEELGFIADEMKAVKERFAADMSDGLQGIKLMETLPYLIKAFQELDERVRKIENDN